MPANALPPTRRELYTRIIGEGCDRDIVRAERLLLRAIDRQWPPRCLEALLARLLQRAMAAGPMGMRA